MPTPYTLLVVDVSGIQDYVFRTNDLQHHLGASELVRRATGSWVRQNLSKPNNIIEPKRDNKPVEDHSDLLLDASKHIEHGDVVAEVIYSGGGNTVILFGGPTDENGRANAATRFAKALTRAALLQAPGLTVVVAMQPFVWHEGGTDLGAQVGELLASELRRKKQSMPPNGEMLGLSVTADCEFTGLPAVDTHQRKRDVKVQRISAEIEAKLDAAPAANERLAREIGDDDVVRDFDEFGSKGEASYIAVIHADGNRMGKRFEALSHGAMPNRAYIEAVRALSNSVNAASQSALRATADAIRNMWREDGKLGGVVPVYGGKLPFRPIIFGGDDATFVCDGRLGLTVAARYLEEFARQTLDEPSGPTHPTARAGIAIVKTHFPFGQAYLLAGALADSAKLHTDEGKHSAMDWHFGINGIVSRIETQRSIDFVAPDADGKQKKSLLMRPLQMTTAPTQWRTWPMFAQLVNALQNEGDYPTNKVYSLREALRGGPSATQRFIAANFSANPKQQKPLPTIANNTSDTGWIGEHCAYFDSIEALEFFVPLEPRKKIGER